MYKFAILLIVLSVGLAACSGGSGQAAGSDLLAVTGTEVASSAAPASSSLPTTDEPATSNADVAAPEGDAQSNAVVYTIVPEESTATYEVGETFIDRGNVFQVAVGQTQGVTGEIRVDLDQPQNTTIGTLAVDVSRFTSDNRRRDSAIRDRFLQSAQYPTVTFAPTEIEGLPETIDSGVDYAITLRGDLTIRDTTKPVAFDAQVRLDGDTLTGQASTTILLSDYGFGPIDILGILKTEDEVKVTIDFVARS